MRSISSSCRILTLLAAGAALVLRGTTRLDAQQGPFRSGVDMVALTVTVTDSSGRHIKGLTGDDFTVFEDGVPQSLSFLASEEVPLDVAFVSSAGKAEHAMRVVARDSGARAFFLKAAHEITGICDTIAQELANQYELGHVPARPSSDGVFRRVAVRVPSHTHALARTRSGYYPQRVGAAR